MKSRTVQAGLTLLLIGLSLPAVAGSVADTLIARYQSQGSMSADPARGEALWNSRHGDRSCTTCHGKDLTRTGKHARTGKPIKPMAPSVNPERYTRERKVEKWFLRNCKWTLGRECSIQEKADILSFLKQL